MSTTKTLIPIFAISLSGLFLAPYLIPQQNTLPKSVVKETQKKVGLLQNISGRVFVKSPLHKERLPALANQSINASTTIWVNEASSVEIALESGLRLELDANTRVHFEQKFISPHKTQTSMELVYGQYNVLEMSDAPDFLIIAGGSSYALSEHLALANERPRKLKVMQPQQITASDIKRTESQELQPEGKINPPTIPWNQGNKTLTDDEIFESVSNKRAMFKRCYMQYLQTNPEARGRMDLSFIIHPSGNIDQVQVQNSSIADTSFKQCVRTAMLRVKFRPFESAAIMAQYPLTFE